MKEVNLITYDPVEVVREEIAKYGSQKIFSVAVGVDQTTVSYIVRGIIQPSAAFMRKLGYEKVVLWTKKGASE